MIDDSEYEVNGKILLQTSCLKAGTAENSKTSIKTETFWLVNAEDTRLSGASGRF